MRIYKINWMLLLTFTLLLAVTNSSPLSTLSPQELLSAIRKRNIERVKELINKNSDDTDSSINSEDENGNTPLFIAIRTSSNIVPLLIAKGADVNHANHKKSTPLHEAASLNKVASIKALLKAGAQINAQDMSGSTPLLKALESNNANAANALIKAGADTRIKNKQDITVLHYVVKDERLPWQSFIKKGADIHARTIEGDTPLHFAARGKNIQAINALVATGAQVNATNHQGRTPLHDAAKSFSSDIEGVIQALINLGASVNVQDAQGDTPLMLGISEPNAIRALLSNGADPFIADKKGQWPLAKALKENLLKVRPLFEYMRGALNYLKRSLQEKGLTPELKKHATELYWVIDKGSKKLLHDDYYRALYEQEYNISIEKTLSNLSRMFRPRPTSASPSFNIAELLAINDISVVDDKSVASPADALPSVSAKPPYTQTQSYLSKEQLKNKVLSGYKGEIVKYPRLIRKIIQQEEIFKNYDVFYHGQMRDFILFYDVIKEIQNWLTKTADKSEFEYLRFPEGQSKKLTEYIELGEMINDNEAEINAGLLPVNVSLFGNTNKPGEGTFYYFLQNRNIAPPKNLLETIFTKLDLNKEYISEILELLTLLDSPTGSLLQIFIPVDEVNKYVYPSVIWGKPLDTNYAKGETKLAPIIIKDKNNKEVTYDPARIDMKTYLDIYRNHPEAIDITDMDAIQGRINITHDFLLNPESGVKIFRYTTVHPEKMQQYKQKLHEIITKIMGESEKKNRAKAKNIRELSQIL